MRSSFRCESRLGNWISMKADNTGKKGWPMNKEHGSQTLHKTTLNFNENCFHICTEAPDPLFKTCRHICYLMVKSTSIKTDLRRWSTAISVHDFEFGLYSHLNTVPYFSKVSPNAEVTLLSGAPTSNLSIKTCKKIRLEYGQYSMHIWEMSGLRIPVSQSQLFIFLLATPTSLHFDYAHFSNDWGFIRKGDWIGAK